MRSLVQALADPTAKGEELDTDAIEKDVRALAAQVLSPEEIAALEAETTAEFIDTEDLQEVSRSVGGRCWRGRGLGTRGLGGGCWHFGLGALGATEPLPRLARWLRLPD